MQSEMGSPMSSCATQSPGRGEWVTREESGSWEALTGSGIVAGTAGGADLLCSLGSSLQ